MGRRSFNLPRALLLELEAASLPRDATAGPAPSPPPCVLQTLPFDSTTSIAVGVLASVASVILFIIAYEKMGKRREDPDGGDGAAGFASYKSPNSGVDRAVLESLPLFHFGQEVEELECVVCLRRFTKLALLRLLPKCRHAFHVVCVDTWLAAHSTCPICRRMVTAEDALLTFRGSYPGFKPQGGIDTGGAKPPHRRRRRTRSEDLDVIRAAGLRSSLAEPPPRKMLRNKSMEDAALRPPGDSPLDPVGASGESLEIVLGGTAGQLAWCSASPRVPSPRTSRRMWASLMLIRFSGGEVANVTSGSAHPPPA